MITCQRCFFPLGQTTFGLTLLAALAIGPRAQATLLITGDVSPADNPFTDRFIDPDTGEVTGNEGIQEFQPFFSFEEEMPDQPTFEEGDEDKVNIEVGRESFGGLIMNDGTILRYGHLVIGGSKDDANAGQEGSEGFSGSPLGVGEVTVEGFGTVYNSSPDIRPAGFGDVNDPSPRPTDSGYDVYVGLTGSGRLNVLNGGRMEIQDGLLIGVADTAEGHVVVDGIGSHIDQRGDSDTGSGGGMQNEPSPLFIGPLGTGELEIRNGGMVDARNGVALGTLSADGGTGIIDGGGGGIPSMGTDGGTGQGTLRVTGAGSQIRSGASISVGTFQEDDISDYEENDSLGDLIVGEGGRVSIFSAGSGDGTTGDPAQLRVGRNGSVRLDDGRVLVTDDVLSDGSIAGDGQMEVGTFGNRRLGRVEVATGQKLRITSSADEEFDEDDTGPYFMSNNGLIDVLGGEIEFRRLADGPENMFLNRVDPGDGDDGDLLPKNGRIHGQDAVMRFGSGLDNFATLALTAGNNVIQGDVINEAGAEIIVSGESNVVFEDNLTNMGVLDLAPDGSVVSMTVLGDFAGLPSAAFNIDLGGGSTGTEQSHVAVAGDVVLDGALNVDLSASGASPLDPMPGDRFELISGAGSLTGAFNALDLPALSDPGWSWGIDTSNSDFALEVLDIMPVGADFNDDGIVDRADLAIWQANFGIDMGATGVLGDADGDGDVDGIDYLIWLTQVGGPGMVPGALASGPSAATAAVPEPGTCTLAAVGLVALAGRYRRRRKA